MSEVRRGEDTTLGRPVAIKLLRGDGDPRSVARFEREARVLARLQHPNVVTVFDIGADGDDRFIVMELVEGPTLREVLSAEGKLEASRAAGIADGITAALAYAHEQNIVHRDVKPSNVLVASGDRVKLADLGIAKLLSDEALTTTTGVIGTAHYIAPEQARGDPVDGRADLYSLGCVLFEMLGGRPPFEGDAAALTYAHVHRPAPRVRSLAPAVPERLDALVAALLEKEPSARPQRASEVRDVLIPATEAAPGPDAVTTELISRPELTRRLPEEQRPFPRWIWPAAATALVGLLLLVLLPALLAGDGKRGGGAGSGLHSQESTSPTTNEPSSSPPELLSSDDAAQHVLDVVNEGVAAGEVDGKIVGDVQHQIDEALRELEDHEDLEKALDKIAELQAKVSDALAKGEITSASRAQTINGALDELATAIEAEAEA